MLRQTLKKSFYFLRFHTGSKPAMKSGRHRLVLAYHGISSTGTSRINARHLPAKQLEEQLRYFRKKFNVVSVQELLASGTAGAKPFLALTFDDGFENNLTTALPLLEKHKVPASFYVPSLLFEKDPVLPSDQLDIVRAYSNHRHLSFAGETFRKDGKHRLLNVNTGKSIYAHLLLLSPAQLETALQEFRERYHYNDLLQQAPPGNCRLLAPRQLQQLASSAYASIGSHTHSHYALTTCDAPLLKKELEHSRQLLEDCLVKTVNELAFPYGDHDERVVKAAKEAGYTTLLGAGAPAAEGVIPRAVIISGGTLEQNLLQVHRAFNKSGF
jgi:peptidoglycan/xylan/chitin deacetylase (PgdA/CDA1 family)